MSKLGVVIVTYNSTDVIFDCLETLLASGADVPMRVVVVDNASADGTPDAILDWAVRPHAMEDMPFDATPAIKPVDVTDVSQSSDQDVRPSQLTVLRAQANGGYAGGVNLGLEYLARDPDVSDFWVLNPDSVVPPGTPAAILATGRSTPGYGIMGGRVLYFEQPELIQIDGGVVNWKTGITSNVGVGQASSKIPPADMSAVDFVTGASMIVSRQFYKDIGPMAEDYFLYYEEVDWALSRGEFPMVYCGGAVVYHKAGTSIGSQSLTRGASPFSLFFKHRARMKFMRRHGPAFPIWAYAYTFAKSAQLLMQGEKDGAMAIIRGTFGLRPPREVLDRLSPEAKKIALGR